MTAPFMAVATNGGGAIKTNMIKKSCNQPNSSQHIEQMSVETFNYKNKTVIDYVREGSVLIKFLNDQEADLYTLCIFNSGNTNTLINQGLLSQLIEP